MNVKARVQSGTGQCAGWIGQLENLYFEKTGVRFFPGSLNVEIEHPWDLPSDSITIFPTETPKGIGIRLSPCIIGGVNAFVVRTDTTSKSRKILEILAPVRLRDVLGLVDGDVVELELSGENK